MQTNLTGHAPRRFLFSSLAGYGHIHPLIPLAQSLQQAGHTVAFATSPSRQALLKTAGFTFFPVEVNSSTDPEYQQIRAQLATMPLNLEAEIFNYNRLFCGVAPRLRAPVLLEITRAWQPDMFIREAGEYGALIVAEQLGLPHATVAFAAALKGQTIFEHAAASQLDPIREKWGLAADPDLNALYRYLYLSYSPPSFGLQSVEPVEMTHNIPRTTHFIHPEFYNQANQESLPDWLSRLPQQPTVYVTLGTEVNNEPDLYPRVLQTIIAGLRDLPINLIVTLGRDKDPADFGTQPANVRIERYIPQSLLLKHCDVMVMHGGSNSLLEAVDSGLPLVIIPLIADQFFNAQVAQKMQLGQVVQQEQLTPRSIRAALEEILNNLVYRQNVEQLQAKMHALPGQSYAVELIKRVATERQPVLNPALVSGAVGETIK